MSLSPTSLQRLSGCHTDLQRLVLVIAERMPIAVVCGYRGQLEQHEAFMDGKSKLDWPNSKHNSVPSLAVDIAPLEHAESGKMTIDWKDTPRFGYMVGRMVEIAQTLNIKVRAGADWDGDTEFQDEDLNDFPHFELVNV